MVGGGVEGRAALEYSLLEGPEVTADLALGEAWSFGRDERCTETLVLPALSRVALAIRHVEPALCRVSSRQSGMGRVAHRLRRSDGSATSWPWAPGRCTCSAATTRSRWSSPRSCCGWPWRSGPNGRRIVRRRPGWSRPSRPRNAPGSRGHRRTRGPTLPRGSRSPRSRWRCTATRSWRGRARTSESLRRLCGLWCGHTSFYWVNERLKEAVEAADLVVPEGGERLALTVAHYGDVFPTTIIRRLRDAVLARLDGVP